MIQQIKPQLLIKEITDIFTRKNFERLSDYFSSENQLYNFKFFELEFTKSVSNTKVAHGLGIVPQDILVTKIVGSGSVTFNQGLFDTTNIDLTVVGACRVRFFVGLYWASDNTILGLKSDSVTYQASTSSSGTNVEPFVELPLTNQQIRENFSPGSTGALYYVRAFVDKFIFVEPASTGFTAQLPLASECEGQYLFFRNRGSGTLTVQINPKDTAAYIETSGVTSVSVSATTGKAYMSNGEFFMNAGA